MDIYAWSYGILTGLVLALTWLSGNHVYQKLAILLLSAWAFSNVAVALLGFGRAPLFVPSLDALIAVCVAIVGYVNRSRVALVVFLLYAVVGAVHVGAFLARMEGTYTYYATLNVLFLLQLITIGGAGAWMAIRNWPFRRDQRHRPDPARRQGMEGGGWTQTTTGRG